MGHKVVAARLLYGNQPAKNSGNQIKAFCMVIDPLVDQEHETMCRRVIEQVDTLLERLPLEPAVLAKTEAGASYASEDASACDDCVDEIAPQLLAIVDPWLIYGTKDCGLVITHVARRLFSYALQGLHFGDAAARLIKCIHDAQVTKLREAKDLKSKPHSIRRVILNLVQGHFYSRAEQGKGQEHHQDSVSNAMFLGQLLLNDLLIDSAIHESLAELVRPRNRPDTLSNRLEMACCILMVAGQRLDQGACMDKFYAHLERAMQSAEVQPSLQRLFADICERRAEWLRQLQSPTSPPASALRA